MYYCSECGDKVAEHKASILKQVIEVKGEKELVRRPICPKCLDTKKQEIRNRRQK